MTKGPLKRISNQRLIDLKSNISINRERYESGNFHDLETDDSWGKPIQSVIVDFDLLKTLDGSKSSAEADIDNSIILYNSLKGMTAALATDARVWTRLTHFESLDYARARWLAGKKAEKLDKLVDIHMVAGGRSSVRDDNALSRLWWNMHIAREVDSANPEHALRQILSTSDVRSNIIERANTGERRHLVRGIIRALDKDPWYKGYTSGVFNFREFMKVVNREGGGILFEVIADSDVDTFMDSCKQRAINHLGRAGA